MAVTSLKSVMLKSKTGTVGVIKRLLHAHVGGYELPRPKRTIHASELTKQEVEFCPRKYRLLDEYDAKERSAHVDTAMATTYHEGRDKQARFNNEWLRDRMVGDWKCTSCGKVEKFTTAPKGCSNKDVKCLWVYEEVRIEDPVAGHSGGLDGLVIIKAGEKLRLVEVKIMDKDMFKKLEAPLAEHKVRTQLYLRTIAKSKQAWAKQIDTEEASVLYIMRGFGIKDESGDFSPFKEYAVRRDHKGVAEYAARAHAVTLSRREPERGYPCGVCKTMMTDQARACPVAKQCFGAKHPATITWARDGKPVHTHTTVQWIADGTQVASKN